MWKLLCCSLLVAAVGAAAIEKRDLTSMDAFSIQSFTALFRETLLNKVAVEWNITVDQTEELKKLMVPCRSSITAKTDSCTACAKSKCQTTPSFMDYLNLVNPFNYLKGPLNDIAGSLGDVVDLLQDKSSAFLNSIGDMAKSVGSSLGNGVASAFNAVKDQVSKLGDGILDAGKTVIDTGSLIGNGITDLGHGLTDGIKDAGHTIEHAGSSLIHHLGGLIGKRAIDPQARACMQKCDSCRPLLLDNQQETIKAICGSAVTELNNTINARVNLIKGIYDASIDKVHPIIKQIEYDPTSMNSQMQFTRVFITAYRNGHYVRYQTQVKYAMMNLPQTALDMALEYWSLYDKN